MTKPGRSFLLRLTRISFCFPFLKTEENMSIEYQMLLTKKSNKCAKAAAGLIPAAAYRMAPLKGSNCPGDSSIP